MIQFLNFQSFYFILFYFILFEVIAHLRHVPLPDIRRMRSIGL
jgi:hypothetical protein